MTSCGSKSVNTEQSLPPRPRSSSPSDPRTLPMEGTTVRHTTLGNITRSKISSGKSSKPTRHDILELPLHSALQRSLQLALHLPLESSFQPPLQLSLRLSFRLPLLLALLSSSAGATHETSEGGKGYGDFTAPSRQFSRKPKTPNHAEKPGLGA